MPRHGELLFVTARVTDSTDSKPETWVGTGTIVPLSLRELNAPATNGLMMQKISDPGIIYFFPLTDDDKVTSGQTLILDHNPLDPTKVFNDLQCTEREGLHLVEYQFSTKL